MPRRLGKRLKASRVSFSVRSCCSWLSTVATTSQEGKRRRSTAAEAAFALLVADEIVHAADHQDLPALRPQESSHQFAGDPAGDAVVAADIGDAAARRQVAGDRHDRDALADGLERRRDARMVVAEDDQPVGLLGRAMDRARHRRRLQAVEIMQAGT